MDKTFIVEAVRASLGEVYLVGGAVRDSLIGEKRVGDLDFATPLEPHEVKRRLESDGYKVVDYSINYGTVATSISQVKVEVTTFRKETYRPGDRKPSVDSVSTLLEDLSRRDFTINAIAHDGENYIDPFDGEGDIVRRKIRTVGDPIERFSEDPLRMLRALRFVSNMGFTLEGATYDALISCANLLPKLSAERISSELDKIICGEHWVQAISLGIETDVFSYIFGIKGSDEYINEFLESLSTDGKSISSSKLARWEAIVLAILYSARNNLPHVQQSQILHNIFEHLKDTLAWSNAFTESLFERTSSESRKNTTKVLQDQLDKLEKTDTRRFIVQERLLKLEMREAFKSRNIDLAAKIAGKLLQVQNINFDIKVKSGRTIKDVATESLPYYLDTLRYTCASEVLSQGFIENAEQLNALIQRIMRKHQVFELAQTYFKIGLSDRAQVVEVSILMLMYAYPSKVTSLTKAEVIEANKELALTDDRLQIIKKEYITELIALRRPPYAVGVELRRAHINKKVASVIVLLNHGVKDKKYYSHMVDYHKWRALATKDKEKFWKYFEDMNIAMDSYAVAVPVGVDLNPQGQYVDTAQCLIHLLSMESELSEKISLVRSILINYHSAGHGFERNVPRYTLLREWLTLAQSILDTTLKDVSNISAQIRQLKSYNYVDIDEEYIKTNMPEIERIRSNLSDAENFLALFKEDRLISPTIHDAQISATVKLMEAGLIDPTLALEIYKHIVKFQVDQDVNMEPVSLIDESYLRFVQAPEPETVNENSMLIAGGESDSVEFKQSWRYDVKNGEVDRTGEIQKSAQKAIVAFMNTDGGTLFMGVDDRGVITGLETADFKLYKRKELSELQLRDEIKKNIDNTLSKSIGSAASTAIKIYFDVIDGKTIGILKVERAKSEIFLDNKFYVRNSASNRELVGADLIRYTRTRQN